MRAPSNSNIQPWHTVFASGPARDRLVTALLGEAIRKPPKTPPLPEAFAHLRRELGAQVYGSMGIARKDTEARWGVAVRNWEFFRAPLPASSASTATSARSTVPLLVALDRAAVQPPARPLPGALPPHPGGHRRRAGRTRPEQPRVTKRRMP